MHRKLLSLFLAFAMLMPSVAFAETISESEQINENQVVEEELPEAADEDNSQPEILLQEEADETPQELLPSIIKNAKIKAVSISTVRVSWECDAERVYVTYAYDDFYKSVSSKSDYYDCKDIPFGKTVTITLATDEEHELLTLKCTPSDDMTPVAVKNNVVREFNKNRTDADDYCYSWEITAKNGNLISIANYSFKSSSIKGPGIYDVTITFKDKYEKYKPLHENLIVCPVAPNIGISQYDQGTTNVKFRVVNPTAGNTLRVQLSESKDYSNPITKKITVKDSSEHSISGLKSNTKYYMRSQFVVTTKNDKTIYSEWDEGFIYTSKKTPTYSPTQTDIKNIVNLMKKNKKFTYTFKGHYNISEMFKFLRDLPNDYPQYADRYDWDVDFDNESFKVTYTIDKKNFDKAVKTEKVINSIVKGAKKKKSAKAKVKYVNTKMCNLCKYDYDTYKRNKKYSADAYSAYGCLVRHKAVCAGYSAAFRAIMVQLGIPNKYAEGKNHRWNKVKIGKTWYHVDVTWNDGCGNRTKYLLKKSHR